MNSLVGVRALVTGGAGFIGSEVVRQLCNLGAKVMVFDNLSSGKIEYLSGLDVDIIRDDVSDEESVNADLKDQELIFHLAALPFIPDCYEYPVDFFKVNTIGTLNVMWGAIRSSSVQKVVHISSSEVYGTAKYVPMDESHPTLPHSTYAVSKLAAERAVFSLHKEHNFPVVIIRPFNSFGPRVTEPYIIPEIIIQLLHGDIVKLGNVDSSRDFTFVSDTARGIIMASTEGKAVGETINLGSGEDMKIKDLVYSTAELMGKGDKVKINHDRSRLRPYDVDRLVCNRSKAKKLLGWEPQVSMREGLKMTIDWIKNNPVEFKEPFTGRWSRSRR